MPLRGQAAFFTGGSGGRTGGRNDQCFCHFAPSAIQRRSVSICAAVSVRPDFGGGIRSPSSCAVMRRNSSLFAGSPGVSDFRRPLLGVEAQVGLALGLVGAVALEAGVGEDRAARRG